MFAWWGRMVYRYRFFVVVAMTAACLGAGVFGISLGEHVTQSGFFDDGSESAQASRLADTAYGRDTSGHIIAIYTAPEGTTVDDPAVRDHVNHSLDTAIQKHPDEILRAVGYFTNPEILSTMADASRQHAFMSIQLRGDDDDTILNNYKKVANSLGVDGGVEVQLAGLQPLANELTSTIGTDQKRMELLALPLVAIVLFFVFGGVVAACLPNPAELGPKMKGKTCAGLWVTGTGKDGRPRSTYLYHVVDNEWSMAEYGHQCVVWQTAVNPVVALELLANGTWSGAGVLGPEAFDAVPFLELLTAYGSPWGIKEL